ncbi:RNA 3'-terminal phosphate cyclase [Humisphaera borealis]|uniref:RNA 3'-terminal phosphate cyclase n=1 Tax=Humisphaera borealis TaxID=2807512 RepID=A0A7M2WPX2_9BACT|nr:RNA 3'-terminal phosphate cyclase [Humisphaera borealis]QOV87567.1 RNA 3'-terminal phosphate cyclase [Humisphaera borealis]
MITIDGSQGEGGGQVLRTSLGLSMLTGTPFRITRIRANRDKPGLMRQHLTCVLAAAQVCSAEVVGAAVGSSELTFKPGTVRPGDYTFSVGTAGSTTLVLQAVLPALLRAASPSTITLEGGTHNIFAPPVDFLEKSFLAVVNRMGPSVAVTLDRYGFYPAGGGRWTAAITPSAKLDAIEITKRLEITHRRAVALVAGLPGEIGMRELETLRRGFSWEPDCFQIRQLPGDCGPGNVVMIEIGDGQVTEVFTAFGERGVRAEAVAERCIKQARAYLAAGAPVGEHLADQLLIPLAMAGGGSFVTGRPTEHTRTNIDIVQKFLPVTITMRELEGDQWGVEIAGI